MKISVLTLFPHVIEAFIGESIIKRAQEKKLVTLKIFNLRDFTHDSHKTVDDHPFGGGTGMLLKIEPLVEAIEHIEKTEGRAHKILLSPKGNILTQESVSSFVPRAAHVLLLCGHYEGFDARIEHFVDEEISIGKYVLSSGESAALVFIDALVRLIPGVLKKEDATKEESFQTINGEEFLEYPQYTVPRDFRGHTVPEVLLSGDHKKIEAWKKEKRKPSK